MFFPLLFQAPGIVSSGTVPVHAPLVFFDSEREALEAAGNKITEHANAVLLNGKWKFRYLENPEDLSESDLDADASAWNEIQVPGAWTLQGYDRPHYTNVQMPYPELPPKVPRCNPSGIYTRNFTLTKKQLEKRGILRFDGVESFFLVRLNGQTIGFAKDSRAAHEFDVSHLCREGQNTLTVLVTKWSDANYIEDQDMWWHGGIIRDVSLQFMPKNALADLFATALLEDDCQTGTLKVKAALHLQPGLDPAAGWKLRVRLYAPDGKAVAGFPMEMPLNCWNGNPDYAVRGAAAGGKMTVRHVLPWSAEHPVLYRLSAALVDPEGHELNYTALRLGFRSVKIGKRKLFINGQAVRLHGVNRHESHPRTGRTVSREDMERDLKLMKRHNVNAIRTSHYPDTPEFYDLCDEYGFYVWDEANVESHGFYSSLSNNPAWLPAMCDRVANLLERDKNHPCVIVWSLGNESGIGANHGAMAGYVRFRDPSRPLHYEGAINHPDCDTEVLRHTDVTDIVSPMYPAVSKLYEWSRKAVNDPRPYIMCEYSHAMGNSNGELKDYFRAFDECDGLQGGFIWEWCDHALYKKDENGREYLAYGGDFGDTPNDGNFVCDGIVGAERDVHPGLIEYKYLAQPVRFLALDLEKGIFEAENRQYFSDFSAFAFTCVLSVDGKMLAPVPLKLGPAAARFGSRVRFQIEIPKYDADAGSRMDVTFFARQAQPNRWAEAGFEVAHEQFQLPTVFRTASHTQKNGQLSFTVDTDGTLHFFRNGTLQTYGNILPSFWRAPLDNDGFCLPWLNYGDRPLKNWLERGYDQFETRVVCVRTEGGQCSIVRHCSAPGVRGYITHTLVIIPQTDGSLKLQNRFAVPDEYSDLPRVGLVWPFPKAFDTVQYAGLGPHENYCDRDASAIFGEYSMPIAELPGRYLMPQSAGNRTQVTRLSLQRPDGEEFTVVCEKGLEFSILPYTDNEIFAAHHWHELPESKGWSLHLDAAQRGVGSSSCGPALQERYRLKPGSFELDFILQ